VFFDLGERPLDFDAQRFALELAIPAAPSRAATRLAVALAGEAS
jgi:hypothetical protein